MVGDAEAFHAAGGSGGGGGVPVVRVYEMKEIQAWGKQG